LSVSELSAFPCLTDHISQPRREAALDADEAAAVANLIEMKRKAIETVEIERRIAALE